MDKSLHQHGSDTQQLSGFFASLQIFESILYWLAGLIQLIEEEQKETGVYLGD